MKKAILWCEVACCNCGGTIGIHYKNPKTISFIKDKAKNWVWCEELSGNLCPSCYEEYKKQNKLF